MTNGADIGFVHLGIVISHLRNSITVLGFRIAFYGMIIGIGILAGLWVAIRDARRRGQDPDIYLDFALYAIIFSIIGARIYYVVFNWEYYRYDPVQIINLRGGGLAIYGGIIGAAITLFFYTRRKKLSFLSLADTGCLGLITGQIIGRWGNFFNCEAFGGYTDSLFAMRIKRTLVNENVINGELLNHLIVNGGVEYIQVHPTFLYESFWNLLVLFFLLWYRKQKKFDGEIFCFYLLLYGLGRMWIEGMRTDQLLFFQTGIPVSQALSLILVILSILMFFFKRRQIPTTSEGEE